DLLAQGRHRRLALETGQQHRPRGDVVHELVEERLAVVLRVEPLGLLARQAAEARLRDPEPALLDVREDPADQPALHRVRLDDEQRPLDGHSSLPVYVDVRWVRIVVVGAGLPYARRPSAAAFG